MVAGFDNARTDDRFVLADDDGVYESAIAGVCDSRVGSEDFL